MFMIDLEKKMKEEARRKRVEANRKQLSETVTLLRQMIISWPQEDILELEEYAEQSDAYQITFKAGCQACLAILKKHIPANKPTTAEESGIKGKVGKGKGCGCSRAKKP